MLTPQQEEQVRRECYAIGADRLAPWLRRVIELENTVEGLKQIIANLSAAIASDRQTASV